MVSEALARQAWRNDNPIGQQMRFGDAVTGRLFTVIGVVSDVRYQSLETPDVRPMVYFSYLARPDPAMAIVVRGPDDARLASGLRDAIASVDSRIPPPTVYAMETLLRDATATRRFALVLFGVFAGTALVLAAVGIYGVMAYLVRQSLPELGIRIALGAPLGALVMSVVGRAVRLAIVGVAIGVLGAWWLTGVMEALLFEVGTTDRLTFAFVSILLVLVSAVASLVPARSATRADPLSVLRGG
jgi:ABC-type antimicrobial peptide transport system permease subunit